MKSETLKYEIPHNQSKIVNIQSKGPLSIITYSQIHPFMQNKPKVKYAKMNVNSMITMRYAKMDNWLFRQTNPIQTQFLKGQN